MYSLVSLSDFIEVFKTHERVDFFGIKGLIALFNHIETIEDEAHLQTKLDVIAICCNYRMYNNLKEFNDDYGDDFVCNTIGDLREYTEVIEIPESESFIIETF